LAGKPPTRTIRLNQTDFDALKIEVIKIFHEQFSPGHSHRVVSWHSPAVQMESLSHSNYPTLLPLQLIIQSANEAQNLKQLSYAVCWSPTGQQVTYIGNSVPPYSRKNPFADQGLFRGDLTIANLQWEHLPDAEKLTIAAIPRKISFSTRRKHTPRQVSENATPPNPTIRRISSAIRSRTVRQGELYL
jgi:hypothetical protein